MKKILLYIFLFTYTTIMFKPLLPYITDTVAHIFWYSSHISTVHYENGQYHVHIESGKISKKSAPEKNNSIFKKDISANEYFIHTEKYSILKYQSPRQFYYTSSSKYINIYFQNDSPPPRA
jgi:hypothetical protein